MATLDPIPQARVVRNARRLISPPPAPRRPPSPLAEQARSALTVAIGMWPLTAVLLMMLGLLYYAGDHGAP